MGTATRILRDLPGWRGEPRLYRVTPPAAYMSDSDSRETTEYVVVCAIVTRLKSMETCVFATDAEGSTDVLSWMDMACLEGSWDHEGVLKKLGYTVSQ